MLSSTCRFARCSTIEERSWFPSGKSRGALAAALAAASAIASREVGGLLREPTQDTDAKVLRHVRGIVPIMAIGPGNGEESGLGGHRNDDSGPQRDALVVVRSREKRRVCRALRPMARFALRDKIVLQGLEAFAGRWQMVSGPLLVLMSRGTSAARARIEVRGAVDRLGQ